MATKQPLSVKWVIIGAAVIIGLNQLLTLTLAGVLLEPLLGALGEVGGLLTFSSIVAVGSFFVGGLLIGWLSPGETLKEPAVAATLAIVVNLIVTFGFRQEGAPSLGNLFGGLIIIVFGYALGLLGAMVGERIQGDTTDKMRERGELRGG